MHCSVICLCCDRIFKKKKISKSFTQRNVAEQENAKQRKKLNFESTIWPNGDEFEKNKTWVFSPIGSIR